MNRPPILPLVPFAQVGGFRARAVLIALLGALGAPLRGDPGLVWRSLPDLPGGIGFAAMYAGVSHGVLLAGGGTHFVPSSPGAESVKTWHDSIFALQEGANEWVPAGRLPRRGGYGVCARWQEQVVCVSGSDERGAFGDAWTMEWTSAGVKIEALPALPVAAEMASGGVDGEVMYVATEGTAGAPGIRVFTLDLAAAPPERRWEERAALTGVPSRKLAAGALASGRLYVFGGLAFLPDGGFAHLRDAYAFSLADGWRRLADLPRGDAGASSPAIRLPDGRLAFWGGLDRPWAELQRTMSHFESSFLVYDPARDAWSEIRCDPEDAKRIPARLGAAVVKWHECYAIIGGEIAPRVRTTTTPWLGFR